MTHGLREAGAMVLLALALLASLACGLRSGASDSDVNARIAFHRARVGGPGTYPHHARLGVAYLERSRETGGSRDLKLAERHLRLSLEQQRNFEALVGLAALQSHRHRFDEARTLAEEALSAAPDSLEARGVLVEVLLERDEVDAAAQEVERMLARGPSFEAFAHESAWRAHRGEAREALAAMERACSEASAAGRSAGTLAWCAAQRGKLVLYARCDAIDAEFAYHEALSLVPGHVIARRYLGQLRALQKQGLDGCPWGGPAVELP